MKKNFFWILSVVLFGFAVATTNTSCTPEDACVDANCVNGSCFEDGCVCDVGYALDINGFCTDCESGYTKDVDGNCVLECVDSDCGANAQCENNVCTCIIGYEENATGDCVLERDKFLGVYDVVDVCDSDTYPPYEVTIDELIGSVDMIRMENLSNLECLDADGNPIPYFVEASIFESSLSFTDFTTCGATWTGNGTMDAGVITMTYSLISPDDNCSTTLTKK